MVESSSSEAVYVAVAEIFKEVLYLRQTQQFITLKRELRPHHYCFRKTKGALICQQPGEQQRTQHVDVKYLFIRHALLEKDVSNVYVGTQDQHADMLTKLLNASYLESMPAL